MLCFFCFLLTQRGTFARSSFSGDLPPCLYSRLFLVEAFLKFQGMHRKTKPKLHVQKNVKGSQKLN